MKIKCKKCRKPLKRRKNYPHGRMSKSRTVYYCPRCSRKLKGGDDKCLITQTTNILKKKNIMITT